MCDKTNSGMSLSRSICEEMNGDMYVGVSGDRSCML